MEEITFPNVDNVEITASPFKTMKEDIKTLTVQQPNRNDIKNIQQQLNYTNQLLYQVANTTEENEIPLKEETSKLGKSIITPYKLSDSEIKDIKIGKESSSELLNEINKRLASLKISSSKVNMIKNEDILELEKQFDDTEMDTINKIKNTSKNTPLQEIIIIGLHYLTYSLRIIC